MNVELKKNRKPRDSGDCRSGLGREFFPRGAAVWIPVALFVLLVLFQMVPLPAGVLRVVSPATYELYEEMLPEDGGRLATKLRSASYARQADSHRHSSGQPQYHLPELRGRPD